MKKQISKILLILLTSIFITGCSLDLKSDKPIENGIIQENVQLTDIPEFNDEPYIVLVSVSFSKYLFSNYISMFIILLILPHT